MGLFDDFISAAGDFLSGVKDNVVNAVSNAVDKVVEIATPIVEKVSSVISTAVNTVSTYASGLYDKVSSAIGSTVDKAQDIYNDVSTTVGNTIQGVINNVSGVVSSTVDTVKDAIAKAVDDTSDDSEDVVNTVKTTIDTSVKDTSGGVAPIVDKIPPVTPPAVTVVTQPAAEMPASLLDAVKAIPSTLVNIGEAIAMMKKLADLAELMHSPDATISAAKEAVQKPPEGFAWNEWGDLVDSLGKIGVVTGQPLGFFPIVGGAYEAGLGQVVQNVARVNYTPSRISIGELATLYARGLIDLRKLVEDSSEQGFRPEDIVQFVNLTRQLMTARDLVNIWLRGELSEDARIKDKLSGMTAKEVVDASTPDTIEYKLAEAGISGTDIVNLKSLAYIIPNYQDIITMAVREAFTPEIAEAFGQYQDYPEEATEWFTKQGLSLDWAKRYWASHWQLPSVQMAFEMFQRTTFEPTEFSGETIGEVNGRPYYKVIDEAHLNVLLRALDIMPAWREKLTYINYAPLTRVDIRRMHKLGILDRDGVFKAHLDIGYSPESAEMLTQFTLELNKEESKLETQPQRDLTASEILSMYADNVLDSGDVSGMLLELGYSRDEIDNKIALADAKQAAILHGADIAIIKQRFVNHIYDINTAIDELNKLDLPKHEYDYQLKAFQIAYEAQVIKDSVNPDKMLTSTEITSAYAANIIGTADATSLLADLGFNDYQISIKLALVDVKRKVKALP